MGFGFLFKKKENTENEMKELLNEDNIIMEGNFECTDFISLKGGNPNYIYCEQYSLNSDDDEKLVEELALRSGVDKEKAKDYSENAFVSFKIYMDKKGKIDFILEIDCTYHDEILEIFDDPSEIKGEGCYGFSEEHGKMVRYKDEYKEIELVMTEKERELLIKKAKEHFDECFGVDLMKLPEMVKGCHSVEQLYDKFEVERGKGVNKIVESYGIDKMTAKEFDEEDYQYRGKTVLACTFSPNLETSMQIRKEAGMQGKGTVECTALFNNHMNMILEVSDGSEKKKIEPKRSLEKEIRAGISAMYQKHRGFSLEEYMPNVCPQVYYDKISSEDTKYYCREMRKQKFFNEEMTPDFYDEERLNDWALELLCNYQDYNITPFELHKEFDYYKYPDSDTRYALLQQLREYKVDYQEMLEFKESDFYKNIKDEEYEEPF